MGEQQLRRSSSTSCYEELRRIADELEAMQRRLACWRRCRPRSQELSRLSRSIEALAYAALGREGPRHPAPARQIASAAIAMPIASISDVDRRAVAAVHEGLVELVRAA